MKISLRLEEDQPSQFYQNPLIKAKIPITIFNQPFTSSIATVPSAAANSSSHLSFSLSSNFSSGPAVKLSYSHTSTEPSPFSVSLKSGLGLLGSPNNSPLVFTAHLALSHTNPTFFLHLKPQFGNFSLKKTSFSDPNPKQISGSSSIVGAHSDSDGDFGNGFVSEGSSVWQELKLEPYGAKNGDNCGAQLNGGNCNGGKEDGFLSGIAVMARTVLPVTKRVAVIMRWGVNFPAKFGPKMPYLTVNKIGIERVEEGKVVKEEEEEKSGGGNEGDFEMLKGMCFWMRRDLELLGKENKEMKQRLEEMKVEVSTRDFGGESGSVEKRVLPPLSETSSGFEQWRKKKNAREENGRTELKTSTTHVVDVEFELQRAIEAASGSQC